VFIVHNRSVIIAVAQVLSHDATGAIVKAALMRPTAPIVTIAAGTTAVCIDVLVPRVSKEVESVVGVDVGPVDGQVAISVWSLLLVAHAQQVQELVSHHMSVLGVI